MDEPKSIYGSDQPPLLARPRPRPNGGGFPIEGGPRDPYAHHSHRRRRRKHRHSRAQGWIWFLIMAGLGLYLAYLVYNRRHPLRPPEPPPVAVEAAKPAPVLAGVEVIPLVGATQVVSGVRKEIRAWKEAREALPSATELQKSGQLEGAVLRLNSALAKNPLDLDLRAALAEIQFQQRDYVEAERNLLHVLAADPDRASARLMLALTYESRQQHEDSLAVIEWMVEKDPYGLEVHQMAARAYLALRRPADALTHLKRVTAVQRDNISAHNLLAQAQMQLGQFQQAVDTLSAVLKLDERNSSSYYNLAVCQIHHGGVTQVVDTLNRAVSMFGAPFVASWAGSAELSPLRTNEYFTTWEERLRSTPPPAPATNGPPVQPALDRVTLKP